MGSEVGGDGVESNKDEVGTKEDSWDFIEKFGVEEGAWGFDED